MNPSDMTREQLANSADQPFIESLRQRVEDQYSLHRTGCGASFGEILCHELHHGGANKEGLDFISLAHKWNIPVSVLGRLIADHCDRLEPLLRVRFDVRG